MRGWTWDSIPIVDSVNEHFTCKYMCSVYFFVSMLSLARGRGWRPDMAANLASIYLIIIVVV